ncbi:Aspartate 1-decarboxylase precursor (Aspartate alpha-decarboxylase) (Contains: Aspartate 1-decarboxylase beta chain; Aspartate 1-decarboxylase alpha chain) [Thiomonas sp. CB2]|jgi:aspartate 1-decarboxylase|uniref:aspartate 1-decarboxylase n=1 Tax=Thiomonas sp. TaxID=2047785 RepID=UPI0004DBC6DD|nr:MULTISPECIES: aspartate 1-decarboxylase [Thiomonas]CDW96414.1 Aspartate 1-decarboxylase precursor (Aspartate alpha-decarboxylase) (Contains: Aspartate 1-decarboxylase beta chain; Aspartate 1-decarboxylase alpha chain) [Thiomonas sp. CB2]VDY06680.1 aspartate 1-decarboxylase [Thiomonas sp. Bio17B3]VDY10026.1 aspartate 1-decarboxylase [Thiomonas sp. Sup16B3]VDY14954.1 Aspartate 1-decarboxylase precursor (Aspartate alpha- decarboxylase) [Contains: Aspartate 1-decarboxylase beta chain; Aspartate 
MPDTTPSNSAPARVMLRAKIHRATLTGADLHYEGSCGIDQALLDACDIIAGEQIEIYNVTNGARLSTYAIAEPKGSGNITLNGSAARHAAIGDLLIICTYSPMADTTARKFRPRIALLDARNGIASMKV